MKLKTIYAILCAAGLLIQAPQVAAAEGKADKKAEKSDKSSKSVSVATLPPLGEVVAPSGFIDPFAEREVIIKKYRDHLTIGLYPSAGGRADIYYLMRNYLPLANYVSHKLGMVVTLAPEKNIAHYRKKIAKQEYGLVYVHAPLADSAIAAGYIPVVKHSETLVSSFVVRADSKFKKLEDLSGAKIGWVGSAQTTLQAKSDIIKAGFADKVVVVDAGSAGQGSLAPSLSSGNIDVAVVRKTVADKMVKDSDGKFTIIHNGFEGPGFGLFAKKDAYSEQQLAKIAQAFIAIKADAGPAEKDVTEGIARGSGLRGQFLPSKLSDYTQFQETAKVVNEVWQGSTYSVKGAKPAVKPGIKEKAPEKVPEKVEKKAGLAPALTAQHPYMG